MWLYVGDVLWGPEADSPLVAKAICSSGAFLLFCGQAGRHHWPQPAYCQVLPYVMAASKLVGQAGYLQGWLGSLGVLGKVSVH